MGDFFDMENTFTDDTVDMLELVKRYRADNSYVFYASLYEGIRITIKCYMCTIECYILEPNVYLTLLGFYRCSMIFNCRINNE